MKALGQSTLEVSLLMIITGVVLALMLYFIKASIGGRVKGSVTQLTTDPYYNNGGSYNLHFTEAVSSVRTVTVDEDDFNPNNKTIYDEMKVNRSSNERKQLSVDI